MTYMLFTMVPTMVLSGLASFMVNSTFAKYETIPNARGINGADAARIMLERQGVTNCTIERVEGRLSDHYDPRSRTLRLSEPVFDSTSLSAVGVACHEAGHALQHAKEYPWLGMRSTLVPVKMLTSKASMPIIMVGFMLQYIAPVLGQWVLIAGCVLFAAAVLFAVVTLPVEWDASARAKTAMVEAGIVTEQEVIGSGRVLNAAFLTYLAAAIASILTLLYYLHRAGVLRAFMRR